MMGLLRSLVMRVRLFFLRRRQMESLPLRRLFKEKYDIDVGLYSYGCFDRWRMPGPLRIGRYCSFDSTVRLPGANHPMNGLTTHPALYDPALGVVDTNRAPHALLVVEDDVWVGHNVTILPGCTFIGRGAVIGAGAVVTRDVAPYAIMAGSPARKIRDRLDPDVAAAIDRSRWWELDLAALRELVARHPDAAFAPSVSSLAAWKGAAG